MAESREITVDADGAVLGRLASNVAKRLLEGESVVVINIEKAIITGEPKRIFQRYKEKLERGDRKKGPFYPRQPDRLFHRVVRGMLPYKQKKGNEAIKRLKIIIGKLETEKSAQISKGIADIKTKYVTVGELCERFGAKPRWKEVK